jgi:hypothetical protein
MCARVRLVTDYSELKIKFWIKSHAAAPNLRPSWNLAPTDPLRSWLSCRMGRAHRRDHALGPDPILVA